jgi:D-methionine transport system permease protein
MSGELMTALWETLYMVSASTGLSLFFGFLLAVVMVMTGKGGLSPCRPLYLVLDVVVNLTRSFPFIILMIVIIPFTRALAGTSLGSTASIVPLTVAATPMVARILEGSLLEVNKGMIEAAQSFGAGKFQIIWHVLVKEALPAIILNIAIIAITILGYSAMAGAVSGGGLGDLAIKYGYNRFQTDVMIASVVILILIVIVIQTTSNILYKKLR